MIEPPSVVAGTTILYHPRLRIVPLPNQRSQTERTAMLLALRAHGDQSYGRDVPYAAHLFDVVLGAAYYGVNEPSFLAACWLHDTVEDTPVTLDEIASSCGRDVARLVWAVTDEPGESRRERKEKTLEKTRRCGPAAVLLKLLDRRANVSVSARTRRDDTSRKLTMYRAEHNDFRSSLYDSNDQFDSIWNEIESYLRVDS